MGKIKCPYCDGTNLKKSGFNESGTQRYYCKDCNRKFTPGFTKPIPKINPKIRCPHCNSNDLSRYGSNERGVQRYLCKKCNKSFIENYIGKEKIICPKCNSEKTVKSGNSNPQRYRCTECHHRFYNCIGHRQLKESQIEKLRHDYALGIHKAVIAKELGISERTVYNYTRDLPTIRKPRKPKEDKTPLLFKSKEEKNKIKKTLVSKIEQEKKKEEKERKRLEKELLKQQKEQQALLEKQKQEEIARIEKEKREKLELQKIIKQQKQKEELRKRREKLEKRKEYINALSFERRDLISDENKKKLEYLFYNYLNNKLSKEEFDNSFNKLKPEIEEQINMSLEIEKSHVEYNIKKDILSGYKLNKVAEKYHKDISYIEDKAKEYYKTETLNSSQIRTIIQYGIIMNTPVEYVAPYIPCSEHMFYKIINQYKDKKFKIPSVKLDKVVDDNILNDFIPKDKSIKSVD